MPHVEGGEKYYIRKEYTEVSELGKSEKTTEPIKQNTQETENGQQAGTEPPEPVNNETKEGEGT